MPSYRYWRAVRLYPNSGSVLEMSEFQLFNSGARVDVPAILTSDIAPATGTLAQLKDAILTTGPSWTSADTSPPTLVWDFGAPQAVDAIAIGTRVTAARIPNVILLQGSDTASVTDWRMPTTFVGLQFVSGTLIGPVSPVSLVRTPAISRSRDDWWGFSGKGRVRGTVKKKNDPANTPLKRKVRLVRLDDGRLIREQWSDPVTGAYDFQFVAETVDYLVYSLDYTRSFRVAAADYAIVELMP